MENNEEKIVVVYATDDNYAYLAGVSLLSLLDHSNKEMNVYILDDKISQENKAKLLSIVNRPEFNNKAKIYFIDMNSAINDIKAKTDAGYGLNANGHKSFTAYSRLYLPQIMPCNVKKLLYLDCDTIIANEGLDELFKTEFESNKIMAAAVDFTSQEYKEWLGIPRTEKYYNTGVMLIDLEKWRKTDLERDGYSDKIFKHMSEHGPKGYPFADQDYINICIRNNLQSIPLKYNVQTPNFMYPTYTSISKAYDLNSTNYYEKKDYANSIKKPIVIHYSGMAFIRPWYKNSNHPQKEMWLYYFKLSPWNKQSLNIWKVNKYSIIREWLYKLLPPSINGFLSGFFLRAYVKKVYKH